MILSFQIPEWIAYRNVALDLYDVERDIAVRQNSKHAIDRKIMPRLIEKRDRLQREVEPLKAAADAAERAAMERMFAPVASLQSPAAPMPQRDHGDDGLDIPEFLRRRD